MAGTNLNGLVQYGSGKSALAVVPVDANGDLTSPGGAGLPTSLGQKTAANSTSVVLASDTKRIEDCALTACGEIAGAAAATACPTVTAKFVRFKALVGNVGNVYLGLTGVTKQDGSTDTTTGLELTPGDDTGWVPATNVNTFFRICDNAGDDLTYWVLA